MTGGTRSGASLRSVVATRVGETGSRRLGSHAICLSSASLQAQGSGRTGRTIPGRGRPIGYGPTGRFCRGRGIKAKGEIEGRRAGVCLGLGVGVLAVRSLS